MNYRKGDKVSILGIVQYPPHYTDSPEDKRVSIKVVNSFETLWMKPEDVTLVTPLFEVGDKCTWGGAPGSPPTEPMRGTILAISGENAWIDMGGVYVTRLLTSIERVDDEAEL